jgi:hypothetical protein
MAFKFNCAAVSARAGVWWTAASEAPVKMKASQLGFNASNLLNALPLCSEQALKYMPALPSESFGKSKQYLSNTEGRPRVAQERPTRDRRDTFTQTTMSDGNFTLAKTERTAPVFQV